MTAPGWLTVHAFLEQHRTSGGELPAYLISQWSGGLAGLVSVETLDLVPVSRQWNDRVMDHVIGFGDLPVFAPDKPAGAVLREMAERRARWGLVVAWDRILGILSFDLIPEVAERLRRRPVAAVESSG